MAVLRAGRNTFYSPCRLGEDDLDVAARTADGRIQPDAHSSDIRHFRNAMFTLYYAAVDSVSSLRNSATAGYFHTRCTNADVLGVYHRRHHSS